MDYKYLGESDGQVGSEKCGFCENCSDLKNGVKWYEIHGITLCEACMDAEGYLD